MNRTNWPRPALLTIGIALFFAGCGTPAKPTVTGDPPPLAHSDDAHPEEGPHHGHLIELGKEEYHAELAHDDKTKTVTVYLLDKEAKRGVAITDKEIVLNLLVDGKPLQAKLAANPQEGDPEGEASRFSITDETVLAACDAPKTTGRLRVTIAGKEYNGVVEIKAHEAHKH